MGFNSSRCTLVQAAVRPMPLAVEASALAGSRPHHERVQRRLKINAGLDVIIDTHLDAVHQRPYRRVKVGLRHKRLMIDQAMQQRARQHVGDAVIRGLARLRIPLGRLIATFVPRKFIVIS